MTTNFVAKGTGIIKQAVQKDNAESFDEALTLYAQGIQYLMTGLKYEKNPKVIQAIKDKVTKYLERAEEIKVVISQPKQPQKAKQLNNGTDQKEDTDTQKLKAALAGAIVEEKPNIKWDDVAGLEVAKGLLKEAVIMPMYFPHLFEGKLQPWSGILLYGPPGTGKSYLAKAVATEADNSTFFSVSSSDIVSKYVGESEKLVKELYTLARNKKPSVIFIDEVDSLASARKDNDNDSTRRLKTEFLVQMQGVGKDTKGVLTLGATNCPWDLDSAVRRRFVKRIYIPLPGEAARIRMFQIHIGNTPNKLKEEDFTIMGQRTKGFSGADIGVIVQDALMEPIRTMQIATHFKKVMVDNNDYILTPCNPASPDAIQMNLMKIDPKDRQRVRPEKLKLSHFLRVLNEARPTVSSEDIKRHSDWTEQFGQDG